MPNGKRKQIREKTGGRCAYCGKQLPEKGWHVDHVQPVFRGWEKPPQRAGDDSLENLLPACRRCNRWKATMTLEQFRGEIEKQVDRLRRDSSQFRLAEDFGLIAKDSSPVWFYFEIRRI